MPHHKISILRKILIPLLAVMTAQASLIYGSLVFGGTLSQMKENAFDIFNKKVSNRKNLLENEMVQRWSNLDEAVGNILIQTEQVLNKSGKKPADLVPQADVTNTLLYELSDDIIYLLRKNSVTGAFIVLNGNGGAEKSGMYFRDSDPDSNPSDDSDLLVERGPSILTKKLGIALDSFWQPSFHFNQNDDPNWNFFAKPFQAAIDYPAAAYTDLAYWSPPFCLKGDPLQVVSYSAPLINRDGVVFGVLGVEITVDRLTRFMPEQELNDATKDGYLLAIGQKQEIGAPEQTYLPLVISGPYFKQLLRNDTILEFKLSEKATKNLKLTTKNDMNCSVLAYAQPLQLYNNNTPFENDQWTLIGVLPQLELLAEMERFRNLILISWVISTLIGIIGIFVVAKMITQPIGKLAAKLRKHGTESAIALDRIHITEIDELLDSIESLSRQVIESSSKLSKILELTGVSIGAFEFSRETPSRVFCTTGFFNVLNLSDVPMSGNYLPTEEFRKQLGSIQHNAEESAEDGTPLVYRIQRDTKTEWVRLRLVSTADGCLGAITDVTQEILERKRIEHDRDFDQLTGLFNRRAFHSKMEVLFATPDQLKLSAMLMMDLDNLKFINDTYGHDYGDEYLRSAATVLKKCCGTQAVISRLSGDEFVVLLYGYNKKDSIRDICNVIQNGMRKKMIYLPDHTKMQIRASAGIAWYPDDSLLYDDLIRYADFAMYLVKKNHKGDFTEFNIESYHKEAYLLYCREELNTIIEESLVAFQFQPIVDAHSGEIFAFEALMRPQTENIKTPLELLSLARSQSKLAQIERLTFFSALKSFHAHDIAQSNCKLFVNSISSQVMDDASLKQFEQTYKKYLKRLVIEITEEERPDADYMIKKQTCASSWGAELALDDFGVGYNGESLLLNLSPHYIKLDMSIVQNVHTDNNRLHIMNNLISYSKDRGIKVIAEGVECREELEVLIQAGVDYLQGYYLSKPTYQPELILEKSRDEILEINQLLAKGEL